MPMTPAQMDRKVDEHFRHEAGDDVEGVLRTLAEDVEHDVVGWPAGATRGRAAARAFYEAMFADLADSRVETLRRLYGTDFVVDESVINHQTEPYLIYSSGAQAAPKAASAD